MLGLLSACTQDPNPPGAKIGTDGTTTTPAAGGSDIYNPPATPQTYNTPEAAATAAAEQAQAGLSGMEADRRYREVRDSVLAVEKANAKAAATSTQKEVITPSGMSLDNLTSGSWGVQVYAAGSITAAGDYISQKGLSGNACVVIKDEVFAVVWVPAHKTFSTSSEATKGWRQQPVSFRNGFSPIGGKKASSPFPIYLADYSAKDIWPR